MSIERYRGSCPLLSRAAAWVVAVVVMIAGAAIPGATRASELGVNNRAGARPIVHIAQNINVARLLLEQQLRRHSPILVAGVVQARIALVIGNSNYASIGTLKNPVNDARVMDQALRALGFQVTRVENATKLQMDEAFRRFTQRITPGGVSIVYYAGHGVQANGRNFLLPVDAVIKEEASFNSQGIDIDAVLGQISVARALVNLVILDACRDNPFENVTARPEPRNSGNGSYTVA